jgi:hypothetical protein
MDEVDRFSEVLDGYSELTEELLAAWTPFLSDLSTKLGAGPYGADEAAADFPTAAKLTLQSMIAVGSEAIDAISVMTLGFGETATVDHSKFAKAPTVRSLAVKADLQSVSGETLPKGDVTIHPDQLPPNETDFTLHADGDGIKARTYDGWVVATDPDGVTSEVSVTVTFG